MQHSCIFLSCRIWCVPDNKNCFPRNHLLTFGSRLKPTQRDVDCSAVQRNSHSLLALFQPSIRPFGTDFVLFSSSCACGDWVVNGECIIISTPHFASNVIKVCAYSSSCPCARDTGHLIKPLFIKLDAALGDSDQRWDTTGRAPALSSPAAVQGIPEPCCAAGQNAFVHETDSSVYPLAMTLIS